MYKLVQKKKQKHYIVALVADNQAYDVNLCRTSSIRHKFCHVVRNLLLGALKLAIFATPYFNFEKILFNLH